MTRPCQPFSYWELAQVMTQCGPHSQFGWKRWLNDIGIPAKDDLIGFNNMVGQLISPTSDADLAMWILGWSLALYPGWMDSFFHTRFGEAGSGGLNFGGYSNAEFDVLATQLQEETGSGEGSIAGPRHAIVPGRGPATHPFVPYHDFGCVQV